MSLRIPSYGLEICDKLSENPRNVMEIFIAFDQKPCFQQFVDSDELPIYWKLANVCPMYKSGCHKNPVKYCPVSQTSIVIKTLEHVIYSHIMAHLNRGSHN